MHKLSTTERLRALLDERGVEWWEGWDKDLTLFDGANGIRWIADYMLGKLFLRSVLPTTPEQAIAATLDDSDATEARRSDAVEVVRCRDCEHARHYHPFYMGKRSSIEEWYCEWHSNAEGASEIEPDGFCAWGERKESE